MPLSHCACICAQCYRGITVSKVLWRDFSLLPLTSVFSKLAAIWRLYAVYMNHNYWKPSFHWHNSVNIDARYFWTKISVIITNIMMHESHLKLTVKLLPLRCNDCANLTSSSMRVFIQLRWTIISRTLSYSLLESIWRGTACTLLSKISQNVTVFLIKK